MTIAFLLRDWQSVGGIQRCATTWCEEAKKEGHLVNTRWWAAWSADAVIIGHTNLLPLAILLPLFNKKYLFLYGIEAWRPLTFWQRFGLWRVHCVIAISQYTWEQAKPYLGDKPVWILPPTASVS